MFIDQRLTPNHIDDCGGRRAETLTKRSGIVRNDQKANSNSGWTVDFRIARPLRGECPKAAHFFDQPANSRVIEIFDRRAPRANNRVAFSPYCGFSTTASMLTALFDVPAFPRFSPWIHFGQNPCRRAARMADVSELAATALRRNEGGNNQLRSRSWQAAARSSKPMEDDCGQPGTCHKARFFSLRYLLVRRDQPMVLGP